MTSVRVRMLLCNTYVHDPSDYTESRSYLTMILLIKAYLWIIY